MKGRGRKRACPSRVCLNGGREKTHKARSTASVFETKTKVGTIYMSNTVNGAMDEYKARFR